MRRGFTLIETISALTVGAILLGVVARPAQGLLERTRAARAAQLVASDLESARATAQRRHRAVRVVFDSSAMRYSIVDRGTGLVVRSRSIGTSSDVKLRGASFAPATLEIYPGGMTSSSLTVTLSAGAASRRVTMSRSGMVRSP